MRINDEYAELLKEIERLREHAIVLAETTRQVERERCPVRRSPDEGRIAEGNERSRARASRGTKKAAAPCWSAAHLVRAQRAQHRDENGTRAETS